MLRDTFGSAPRRSLLCVGLFETTRGFVNSHAVRCAERTPSVGALVFFLLWMLCLGYLPCNCNSQFFVSGEIARLRMLPCLPDVRDGAL